MGKTIIQTIGPLYGEAVNGTVFGRPNGSIYVPSSNTVTLTLNESVRYIIPVSESSVRFCDSEGTARYGATSNPGYVAEAQDLATHVQFQIYSDSDCTDMIAVRNLSAGDFNGWVATMTPLDEVVDGTTYYLRVQLLNNDNPVATSTVIPVVGVVTE